MLFWNSKGRKENRSRVLVYGQCCCFLGLYAYWTEGPCDLMYSSSLVIFFPFLAVFFGEYGGLQIEYLENGVVLFLAVGMNTELFRSGQMVWS